MKLLTSWWFWAIVIVALAGGGYILYANNEKKKKQAADLLPQPEQQNTIADIAPVPNPNNPVQQNNVVTGAATTFKAPGGYNITANKNIGMGNMQNGQ